MNERGIRLKTADDINRIRDSGRIISEIFACLEKQSLAGMSTAEIDNEVRAMIHGAGARSAFMTVADYSHSTCISLNNEVVHGIPSKKRIIRKSDIIKIDIGVVLRGYFSDACRTFYAGPVSERAGELVSVAKACLYRAIREMQPGKMTGDIGSVILDTAESHGFSVVRKFTGHGVGFALHEPPAVPNFGKKGTGHRLVPGMVLAIEPMINEGAEGVVILDDGWTAVTEDGLLSAQFEHTVAVTDRGPVILTA